MFWFSSSSRVVALALATATLFAGACTAPRTIVSTGKVTPKGEFRAGGNLAFNVATETISKTGSALKSAAEATVRKDTIGYSGTIDNLQVAALAYVLDPVRPSSDLYIRYGALDRLDVGYKYAFGSHVFDAAYQFLGPTGTVERPGGPAGATYASIGLQFATQRASLPSLPFLDNIDDILGFRASRQDIIIPLVFSHSLGAEEEIGAISYGAVYTHTFMRYGFEPNKIFNGGVKVPVLLEQKVNFPSFGAFVNAKLGYRYVYFIPSLGIYYQKYGNYQLLNNKTASLSGLTVVPSVGVQFRIPSSRR
ncbi:hypothetical protein [Hymenobacter norwichensis]|uniref:hypothetical protein n=1 Tax=Hymenobacter norwichensis TaxID=223903 RepID=UPI0003F835EE|nr:hypothetical protein [Hymenobacter norwichensis]